MAFCIKKAEQVDCSAKNAHGIIKKILGKR